MTDYSPEYNKEKLENTDIDVEQLVERLERVGVEINPNYYANTVVPFVRQLERSPNFDGTVAGVSFFDGVPVTESEKEELTQLRLKLFSDVAKERQERHVIVSVRDTVQAKLGSKEQLKTHIEKVIEEQEVFNNYSELVWDVFENPNKYEGVTRLEDSYEYVQKELQKRISKILQE